MDAAMDIEYDQVDGKQVGLSDRVPARSARAGVIGVLGLIRVSAVQIPPRESIGRRPRRSDGDSLSNFFALYFLMWNDSFLLISQSLFLSGIVFL